MPEQKPQVYQIKVTLLGSSEPKIWRRFLVPGSFTLGQLHDVIQDVMGWGGEHLHGFTVNQTNYGPPGEDVDEFEAKDEDKVTLEELAPKARTKFLYEYDFGDSWVHEVQVEKILPAESVKEPLKCLKGEGACPPEDSGGIPGYYSWLEAKADRSDPEHEEAVEVLGKGFSAKRFSAIAVNRRLKRLRDILKKNKRRPNWFHDSPL